MDLLPSCQCYDHGKSSMEVEAEANFGQSIAHGSNDVANAVGPWSAAYSTWRSGEVDTKAATPIWILVVAGFLLGAGFWVSLASFLGFVLTWAAVFRL